MYVVSRRLCAKASATNNNLIVMTVRNTCVSVDITRTPRSAYWIVNLMVLFPDTGLAKRQL